MFKNISKIFRAHNQKMVMMNISRNILRLGIYGKIIFLMFFLTVFLASADLPSRNMHFSEDEVSIGKDGYRLTKGRMIT
jgi:hypothetical protein